MIPNFHANTTTLQITAHTSVVLKIEGYFRGTTSAAWLMVFDTNIAPANGTPPLKQIPLYPTTQFYEEFKHGDLVCYLGCWVAISTTEGTYTSGTGDTMDVDVEISSPDLPASVSYVGDLFSPLTTLQVWSESSGLANRQSLTALEVDATLLSPPGGMQWIMVFATDTVNTGDFPVPNMIYPIVGTQVRTGHNKLTFGELGLQPFSIDGAPNNQGSGGGASPGTKRLGCTIKISSTPTKYTPVNGSVCLRAEYRIAP